MNAVTITTGELVSVFLGESKADSRGAEGLLESVKICFQNLGIENTMKEKLTGLTTDGEAANTGSKTGLWVRIQEYLGRKFVFISVLLIEQI